MKFKNILLLNVFLGFVSSVFLYLFVYGLTHDSMDYSPRTVDHVYGGIELKLLSIFFLLFYISMILSFSGNLTIKDRMPMLTSKHINWKNVAVAVSLSIVYIPIIYLINPNK